MVLDLGALLLYINHLIFFHDTLCLCNGIKYINPLINGIIKLQGLRSLNVIFDARILYSSDSM
jgi:hypothetical protein